MSARQNQAPQPVYDPEAAFLDCPPITIALDLRGAFPDAIDPGRRDRAARGSSRISRARPGICNSLSTTRRPSRIVKLHALSGHVTNLAVRPLGDFRRTRKAAICRHGSRPPCRQHKLIAGKSRFGLRMHAPPPLLAYALAT